MALEQAGVLAWMLARLKADAGVLAASGGSASRVYTTGTAPGPTDVTFPYILVTDAGGGDNDGVAGHRMNTVGDWLVQVIDRSTDPTRAIGVASAVETCLHRSSGVAALAVVQACVRRSTRIRPDRDSSGTVYQYVDQMFRTIARKVS